MPCLWLTSGKISLGAGLSAEPVTNPYALAALFLPIFLKVQNIGGIKKSLLPKTGTVQLLRARVFIAWINLSSSSVVV